MAIDLFCGAGGASRGLQQAGFFVIGIDHRAQLRYAGDLFIQADALEPPIDLRIADFVWASPPCQAYAAFSLFPSKRREHPRLIEPTRALLEKSGALYAIENVPAAPLLNAIRLSGPQFGLRVYRERRFETNFFLMAPPYQRGDNRPVGVYGDHPQGHFGCGYRIPRARNISEAQEAMGIDWMDWREITQAIPPAYAEFIGRAALQYLPRPLCIASGPAA